MDNAATLARQLHEAEAALNGLQYEGLELGVTLSFFFDRTFYGYFDQRPFAHFCELCLYLAKTIGKANYLKDHKVSLIYYKSGNHRHSNMLEKVVRQAVTDKDKALIIGPTGASDVDTSRVFYHAGLRELIKISVFLYRHYSFITDTLKPLLLSDRQKRAFWFFLIRQLEKGVSLKQFISRQSSLKLIGADYDRGADSSLFFAVAEALKLFGFNFQHGVINPPVGYAPLNADEIWVWGEMARLQLLSSGVANQRIRIVGTPIVESLILSEKVRSEVLQSLHLKSGKTIVLALSQPDKINDLKLVSLFQAISQQYGTQQDNFLVKIHPSYPSSDYAWVETAFNLTVLPKEIPYLDFLNIVDILLAHTSGIATEVLHYGKRVGILDILDQSPGNGKELNTYFNVPLLKSADDFQVLLKQPVNEVPSNIAFYKTGQEAEKEMVRHIQYRLNNLAGKS